MMARPSSGKRRHVVRGFLLGLSISLAFIVGALSSSVLLRPAAAAAGNERPGWVPGSPPPAKRAEPEPPGLVMPIPRWEYICYRAELTHKLVDVANQAGEEGWEMVGTDGQGTQAPVWCFKRKKNAAVGR
jgi:hypothetical protein